MSEVQSTEREVLDALTALGSRQSMDVVQRTRRSVMDAAQRMQEGRAQRRQRIGIVLLVVLGFLVLATPALWGLVEATAGDVAVTEVSVLTLTVLLMMLSAVMAVMLSRGRRRGARE
jgi:hypothetical protein